MQSKSFYYVKYEVFVKRWRNRKSHGLPARVKTGAAIVDKNGGVLSEITHIPKGNGIPTPLYIM